MAGNAASADGLDAEYRAGKWAFINALDEQSRQGVIAAWLVATNALSNVLDLGCGEGNLCRYLLPHGLEDYLGTDLSEAALVQARRDFPNGRFLKADFNTYEPDVSDGFSAILFNEVLSYADDPARQVARYRHYLRPQGVIAVSMYEPAREKSGAHGEIAAVWAATEGPGWAVLDDIALKSRAKGVTWRMRLARPD